MFARCVIFMVLLSACKDSPAPEPIMVTVPEVEEEVVEVPLSRKQKLEKLYGIQLSKSGDTLLPYIPKDSVESFFKEYGALNKESRVRIETSYGDIDLKLYKDKPLYRASFIFLVKNNYFDNTEFYRIVPQFIVQAGNSDNALAALKRTSSGNYKLPARIDQRRDHRRGTLSQARPWKNNPTKKHNPFDFFICLKSAPHLDREHTIFGEVTRGMSVADEISKLERDGQDWPKKSIFIKISVIPEA